MGGEYTVFTHVIAYGQKSGGLSDGSGDSGFLAITRVGDSFEYRNINFPKDANEKVFVNDIIMETKTISDISGLNDLTFQMIGMKVVDDPPFWGANVGFVTSHVGDSPHNTFKYEFSWIGEADLHDVDNIYDDTSSLDDKHLNYVPTDGKTDYVVN